MIEYFVMFQKFMNFSPEMDKQNTLNNNNENLANNSNYNEADNNNKNEKEKTEEIVNKDKGRRWNPIKRKKSKNYDKDVITNNNEKSKENINIIHKDINTKYADRIKKEDIKEEEKKEKILELELEEEKKVKKKKIRNEDGDIEEIKEIVEDIPSEYDEETGKKLPKKKKYINRKGDIFEVEEEPSEEEPSKKVKVTKTKKKIKKPKKMVIGYWLLRAIRA